LQLFQSYFFDFPGGGVEEICVRERTYYYLTNSCYRRWLYWEPCSQACGEGTSSRFKFNKLGSQKYFTMQTKTCSMQDCPSWSAWKPAESSCDQNCTRLWSRPCLDGKGNVVDEAVCIDASLTTSSLDGSRSNVTHERRPCPVRMCPFYVRRAEEPTTTAAYAVTEASTRSIQESDVSTEIIDEKDSMLRDSLPSTNVSDPQIQRSAKGKHKLDSTATMWIGIIVGFLVICILVLISYIAYESCRKGKLLPSRLLQSTTSQSMSSNNDIAHEIPRPPAQQFPSSSIDRWLSRFREFHQAATLRKASPSSVYLQPNAACDVALLNEYHGIPSTSDQMHDRSSSNNAGSGATADVPCTSRSDNPDAGDPIYADIPAYQPGNPVVEDDIDCFTTDEEDSVDNLDAAAPPTAPSASFAVMNRGQIPGSMVSKPPPGPKLQSNPVRRSATERRYEPRIAKDEPWLAGLGPAPAPPVSWQEKHRERSRSLNRETPYARPVQSPPRMRSVRESSQEYVNDGNTDRVQDPIANDNYSHRNVSHVTGVPAADLQNAAEGHAGGSAHYQSIHLKQRQSETKHHRTSFGLKRKSNRYSDAGTAIANSEFGFHRNPSVSSSSRDGQRPGSGAPLAGRDTYHEPADAKREHVEEAYSTYNLPFRQQQPRV